MNYDAWKTTEPEDYDDRFELADDAEFVPPGAPVNPDLLSVWIFKVVQSAHHRVV